MPRVHHVKSARIAHGDIKVGEPYYWWKFRYGGKRTSRTYPKASQLTQSEYLQTIYGIQERETPASYDELESTRDEIKDELEQLRDEQEEKRSNMPEGLQEGDTGNLLQERYDALDGAINDLENVEIPDDDALLDDLDEPLPEDATDEQKAEKLTEIKSEKLDEIWSEITDALSNLQ
jgi:flagellar biosynthesis chaperone FliJ